MNSSIRLFNSRLHNPSLGILLIRIAVGVVFINAGWLKATNMAMTVGFFGQVGIPAFLAYFVTYAEIVCGITMILGIAVRYAGILLAIIMIVASKLLFKNGFSLANGGYEYNFVLMFISLAIVTLGAGDYTVLKLFKRK